MKLIEVLSKIPTELWAVTGTLFLGYLAHVRAVEEARNEIRSKDRAQTWFELELKHLTNNQKMIQDNLDRSIERLEKDRDYQDKELDRLRERIQEIEEDHAKCEQEYKELLDKYAELSQKYTILYNILQSLNLEVKGKYQVDLSELKPVIITEDPKEHLPPSSESD